MERVREKDREKKREREKERERGRKRERFSISGTIRPPDIIRSEIYSNSTYDMRHYSISNAVVKSKLLNIRKYFMVYT